MQITASLSDGRQVKVTQALETAAGIVFLTTVGERIPACKVIGYEGAQVDTSHLAPLW